MAHDPLDRTDIGRAVPDPPCAIRVLLPGMAHILAMGHPEWVDASLLLCNLVFLGLGAYWLARLLKRAGVHQLFATLYVMVPVAIISLDRMVVDVPMASLALAFAVYLDSDWNAPWKLYLVLAAAALCRETGFLLFAAYAIRLLTLRRYRQIAIFATALLPAVPWICWVRRVIPGGDVVGLRVLVPVWGMLQAVLHPRHYAFSAPVVAAIQALWWLQLGGIVLAIVLAFRRVRELGKDAIVNACFLWACFAIMLPPGVYDDPFAGSRILAPLLMFQFLEGGVLSRLPLLLVTPRVWLELTPQVLGILRGLGK
jgi:hypothetical protein